MTVDPLADWYRHEVIVKRWLSAGAYGPVLDAPETLLAAIHDGVQLVRNAQGEQTVSSVQIGLPLVKADGTAIAYIPVDSEVSLPMTFGHAAGDPDSPRTSTVIVSARGDGGGQPTPDHYVLHLK